MEGLPRPPTAGAPTHPSAAGAAVLAAAAASAAGAAAAPHHHGGGAPLAPASVAARAASSVPGPGYMPAPPKKPSCLACMASKVKCDRHVPCARCVRLQLQCIPNPRLPGRPMKRAQALPLGGDGTSSSAAGRGGYASANAAYGAARPPPLKKAAYDRGTATRGPTAGQRPYLTAGGPMPGMPRVDSYPPFSAHAHAQTVDMGPGPGPGPGSVGRLLLGSSGVAVPPPNPYGGAGPGPLSAAHQALLAGAGAGAPQMASLPIYPGSNGGGLPRGVGPGAGAGPSGLGAYLDAGVLARSQPPPSELLASSSSSSLLSGGAGLPSSAALPGPGPAAALMPGGAAGVVGATLGGRQVGLPPSYILTFVSQLSAGRVHLDRARAVLRSWLLWNERFGQDTTRGHFGVVSFILGMPPCTAAPDSAAQPAEPAAAKAVDTEQARVCLASLAAVAARNPLPDEAVAGKEDEGRASDATASAVADMGAVKSEGEEKETGAASVAEGSSGSSSNDNESCSSSNTGSPTPESAASRSPALSAQAPEQQPPQPPAQQEQEQEQAPSPAATAPTAGTAPAEASKAPSAAASSGPSAADAPPPRRVPVPSTSALVAALSALPSDLRRFLSGDVLDGPGHGHGTWPAAAEQAVAVCGVVWYDGGAAHGGLLPHVVVNDQFSTMLMSKKKVEATVAEEGLRPEHFWEEIMAPETMSAYYEGIVEATFTAAEGTGMAGRVLTVIDRWGLHVTVVASFAVHVSAAGNLHACALRLIPLPQQGAADLPAQPASSTLSGQYPGPFLAGGGGMR